MIESLLLLEKQARTVTNLRQLIFGSQRLHIFMLNYKASDAHSTSRLLVAIVKFCFQKGDLDALNENIHLLSKRRSQLKQVKIFFAAILKICFLKL